MKHLFKNRSFLIGLLAFTAVIPELVSCERRTCPESDPYFNIQDLGLTPTRFWGSVHNLEQMNAGDTAFNEFFRILAKYQVNYYSEVHGLGLWGQPAYALDCAMNGSLGSKESYRNLSIVAMDSFNSRFPAGAEISSICLFESAMNSEMDLQHFLNSGDGKIRNELFSIRLTEAPDTVSLQRFKIRIELENGEIYERTTAGVVIRP